MEPLARHYQQIASAFKRIGPFNLPTDNYSPSVRRFLTFACSLEDWSTACEHFDSHYVVWRLCTERVMNITKPGGELPPVPEQNRLAAQWGSVSREIRFDVRAFYVFSKIPFIAFSAVLFAMAGETGSLEWHEARKTIKRLQRPDAPAILKEFYKTFGKEIRWFDAHINLYRNKFVEHPLSVAFPGAISSSQKGIRLSGLTGRGILKEHEALLSEIEACAIESFTGLSALPVFERYNQVCSKLEHVPASLRNRTEAMIGQVGLESGELDTIAMKLAFMYAGFISFFEEWRSLRLPETSLRRKA